MASRSLNDLEPGFRTSAREVVFRCADDGIDLLIYCTYRSPHEQARLYRQSRTTKEIRLKMELLRSRDLAILADVVERVGPQAGKVGQHVTHAGPGESWHQYGRAFDAVPLRAGKAMWDSDDPAWQVYGRIAEGMGLTWAGSWRRFAEYPHVQDHVAGNPIGIVTPEQVTRMVQESVE